MIFLSTLGPPDKIRSVVPGYTVGLRVELALENMRQLYYLAQCVRNEKNEIKGI